MRNATKFLALLLIAAWVLPANAQFSADWERTASDGSLPSWFGSFTERGFAYGTVGGNDRVYVVSRNGGINVRVLDAATGADVQVAGSDLILNSTGISGGFYALNDVGVTDDGVIVGCNMTLNASTGGNEFRCYTWLTELAVPVASLVDLTADASRLGDKMTVSGSCSDNSAMIWAVAATTGLRVYKYATADNCATFTANGDSPIALNNADNTPMGVTPTTTGTGPDLAPLADGSFWLTGNSIQVQYFGADGDYVSELPSAILGTGTASLKAFSFASRDFLLAGEAGSNNYCRLVEVTGGVGSAAVLGTSTSLGGSGASGINDVDYELANDGTLTAFCMLPNNGVASFTFDPVLPVELTDFAATTNGTSVNLAWATASETNNSGFSVEHFRGGAFAEIGSVAGAGTTLEAQNYGFTVEGLAAGTHRFRLKQTDYDGAFSYSPEVEVEIGMSGAFSFSEAYPNPASGTASFSLSVKAAQTVEVAAYDLLGRKVATVFRGALSEGQAQSLSFDASALPSGLYLLRATGETFSATQRLTVTR